MRTNRTAHIVRTASYSIAVGFATACAASQTAADPLNDFATLNGAKVEVVAEGGIAALSITDKLDHDSRAFMHVTRRLCNTSCQAPSDSASGVVAASVADSVFNVVLQSAGGLSGDYGNSAGAADMMIYTVRITSNGTTRTVRADDGTMPASMKKLVSTVRDAISAARK